MSLPATGAGDDAARAVTLRGLWPLLLGHFCLHAAFAGARLAAPLLILRQGHTTLAVGVMLAMLSITAVALAIPAGRLTDRYGLRRPFAWATCASVAGTALCAGVGAAMEQYWALCVGALLIGIGLNLGVIAVQRHAGRLSQDANQLKQVFSWMSLAPAFSNFAGPFATGLMIDQFGFVAALAVLTALPLVGWWQVSRVTDLHARPAEPQVLPGATQQVLVGQPPARIEAGGPEVSAWAVLQRPGMLRLLMVNALMGMAWDVHTFVVPVLGHERGLSATVIGILLGCFALAATAVRVVLPFVSDHLREDRVICGAMLLTAAAFVVYPFAPGVWTMGVCSAVLGVALGSVQPMVMSLLHQFAPPDGHGLALGLRLTVLNLTSAVFPVLFGAVGGIVGVSLVFWVAASVQVVGARLAQRVRGEPG